MFPRCDRHWNIIYCFRPSRARRLAENLLGILANRWRVFCSTIALSPKFVSDLAFATLVLHNFLRSGRYRQIYCPKHLVDEEDPLSGKLIPGSWRNDKSLQSFLSLDISPSGHNYTAYAKNVRDTFKDYFVNEGAVSWQWDRCLLESKYLPNHINCNFLKYDRCINCRVLL